MGDIERRLTGREPASQTNPWEARLRQQGLNFDIPARFTNLDGLPREVVTDTVAGLVVEDDKMRLFLADRLSQSIRKNEGWARIYADGDHVKTANHRFGRRLGDMAIRYGAATATQLADSLGFPEHVEMYATRQTNAADETVISMYGLTHDQEEAVKERFTTADTSRKTADPNFTFSVTSVVITSSDARIQTGLASTQEFLNQDPNRIGRNFFRDVDKILEIDVNTLKEAKDLERLSVEELQEATNLDAFINTLKENMGGSRIMDQTLETMLEMTSVKVIKELAQILPPHQYIELLASLHLSQEAMNQSNTPQEQRTLYNQIFPNSSSE